MNYDNWISGQDIEKHRKEYKYYREEFDRFVHNTRRILNISYGCSGLIRTHEREHYCRVIVAKLALTARSLYLLCPNPNDENNFLQQHLDFSSSATLSRVIIDTFVVLYHLGIEECSEEEFQVRELLAIWKDIKVRNRMSSWLNAYADINSHKEAILSKLRTNPFWKQINKKQQSHLLRNEHLLHSPNEIIERAGANVEQNKNLYAYWSAHAHCDTMSFINMQDNRRGTGQINVGDIAMLGVCLDYVNILLEFASDKVDVIFCGAEARALSTKHLDVLANKIVPIGWEGLSLQEARENYSAPS